MRAELRGDVRVPLPRQRGIQRVRQQAQILVSVRERLDQRRVVGAE